MLSTTGSAITHSYPAANKAALAPAAASASVTHCPSFHVLFSSTDFPAANPTRTAPTVCTAGHVDLLAGIEDQTTENEAAQQQAVPLRLNTAPAAGFARNF